MPRYNGPYKIIKINADNSTVTLDLPDTNNIFPVFHTSEILPVIKNNETLFPSHVLHPPEPVNVNNNLKHFVEKIVDEKRTWGQGSTKYLVQWAGQGPEDDLWIPEKKLEDCEALNVHREVWIYALFFWVKAQWRLRAESRLFVSHSKKVKKGCDLLHWKGRRERE